MEIYSKTTRFALACNASDKIIEPIQSRCAVLRYSKLTDGQILARLQEVVEKEGLSVSDDGLEAVIFTAQGDMRQVKGGRGTSARGARDHFADFPICAIPGAEQSAVHQLRLRLRQQRERVQSVRRAPPTAGEKHAGTLREREHRRGLQGGGAPVGAGLLPGGHHRKRLQGLQDLPDGRVPQTRVHQGEQELRPLTRSPTHPAFSWSVLGGCKSL